MRANCTVGGAGLTGTVASAWAAGFAAERTGVPRGGAGGTGGVAIAMTLLLFLSSEKLWIRNLGRVHLHVPTHGARIGSGEYESVVLRKAEEKQVREREGLRHSPSRLSCHGCTTARMICRGRRGGRLRMCLLQWRARCFGRRPCMIDAEQVRFAVRGVDQRHGGRRCSPGGSSLVQKVAPRVGNRRARSRRQGGRPVSYRNADRAKTVVLVR